MLGPSSRHSKAHYQCRLRDLLYLDATVIPKAMNDIAAVEQVPMADIELLRNVFADRKTIILAFLRLMEG